ncbi:MAG: hypothetical protein ABTS22_07140, partial [Accumulibacter sp.]|uniref:hypothetical protein n=1 Tax=Accumulibacter sp. TaxID=2053492 RepID=UPI0033163F6B
SSIGITTMTGRRAGSTALLFRTSSDFIGMTFDPQSTWIVGFALYMVSTETTELLRFTDETGTIQGALSIGNDGTIRVYRNSVSSGTLLATSVNALPILTWNYIEVKLTIADSGGNWEVRVNESTWLNFTGDTKQSTTLSTATRIQIWGRGSDNGIDDLYICDGTGSANNSFLGDVRIDTVRPIGAGNYSEFSKQGSASNWDNLDDTTLDSDSTYNYSNTVGQRDTLDCGNLPAITGGIFGVQVNMAARKDDAGGRTFRSLTRVSGTDYEGDSQNVGTDYRYFRQIIEKNPNTTAAWTESEINTAEFGYKVQA